jgi:hypothetical protein
MILNLLINSSTLLTANVKEDDNTGNVVNHFFFLQISNSNTFLHDLNASLIKASAAPSAFFFKKKGYIVDATYE